MKKDASILIVLMGSLGDVARGLCVLTPLKRAFPACRISWLVEPRCAELVRAHPLIDEVVVFDRPRGLAALRELCRRLRASKFDVTLDMQRHFKSGLFSWLSGAPRRIGFHRANAKEFNWLFNNQHVPYVSPRLSKVENYLKFPEYLNAAAGTVEFGLPVEKFSEYLPAQIPGEYALLVLGASKAQKNWTARGYRELIGLVLEKTELAVLLTGMSSEQVLARELADAFPGQRLHNFVARTSLCELLALVGRARICIGPDSGPGHVAALFGVPCISLFGPTDPDRVAPWGMRDLVVRAEAVAGRRRMEDIPAEVVFSRMAECLQGRSPVKSEA